MTTELDALSSQLRALRVDPPDDGFMDRLDARLKLEPDPTREEAGVTRLFGRRRGLLLLSAAAVLISGGAAGAFFGVSPLAWVGESPPSTRDTEQTVATTPHQARPRPRPIHARPRPPSPEIPREAPPALSREGEENAPRRLPSPIESMGGSTRTGNVGRFRVEHSAVESPDGRDAKPDARGLGLDTERRVVRDLPSPAVGEERRSIDERRQQSRRIVPRLQADLHSDERQRHRGGDRPPGETERRPSQRRETDSEPRRVVDPESRREEAVARRRDGDETRRELERTRQRERTERVEERSRERERRRAE